jgi:glycosyltransferase involved in cell wall biosynthesis
MACMRYDYKYKGNTYLVYRTPPSKEAPFKISSQKGITIKDYTKEKASDIKKETLKYEPELVYVAGWTNTNYLNIALYFKKLGVPIITGMDNHWKGTLKQRIACVLSPWLVKKYFTHIWIPGQPQYLYAKNLGFKQNHILRGQYSADVQQFSTISQDKHHKQLLFVGRLVEQKGLLVLFKVIRQLIKEKQLILKIHFIGNGPLADKIPKHNNITHTTFVNPDKLPELMQDAGTFILPSLYEAWGVALHEAALAGLPILSTYETGATSAFIEEGKNGFLYHANDEIQLKSLIIKIANQSETEYFKMSAHSKILGQNISLENWSKTLNTVVDL